MFFLFIYICLFFSQIYAFDYTGTVGLAPGLYCGLKSCYEVIGINRENFNKSDLAKAYRKLARHYHPDKIKQPEDKKDAEEKFRLITTAYETLKDDETKEYYDYYLDHPEERYYNYYQYYRMRATPKVDIRIVILVTILLISAFQYLSAHQKYSEALKYAKEQVKFRNMAIEIGRERGLIEIDKQGKVKKRARNGVSAEEVISAIIEENISISGGYKKHSIYNTLLWHLIALPCTLYSYLFFWIIWIKKYKIQNLDYDDEAKHYLIRKNLKMSEEQYMALDNKLLDEYIIKELWKKNEFKEWKEQKEMEEKEKLANSARHRQYKRYLKKNAGSTISFLED